MFGSLQEFMPLCFTEGSSSSHQEPFYNHQHTPKVNRVERSQIFEPPQNHSHLNQIRFSDRGGLGQLDDRTGPPQRIDWSHNQKQATQGETIVGRQAKNKLKTKDFVADDKTFLLAHYKKMKNHYEHGNGDYLVCESKAKMKCISAPKQEKKASYAHLKGKLKDHHHLLKSLVQVEQMQRANTHTFFELSFKEMSEQFQKVKLSHKIREHSVNWDYPETLCTMRTGESRKSQLKKQQARSGRVSPQRRILMQNQEKWINARSKSLELSGSKDGIKGGWRERRQSEAKRRTMINRIEKLVDPPSKQSKYSSKSTRRNSLYYIACKFK